MGNGTRSLPPYNSQLILTLLILTTQFLLAMVQRAKTELISTASHKGLLHAVGRELQR